MKLKVSLLLLLLLCFCNVVTAQAIRVTGIVVDESSAPLQGVNIQIEDTNNGTTTNVDGEFSLSAAVGATLQFTYVGFESREIVISSGTSFLRIVMTQDIETSEVVVVGSRNRSRTVIETPVPVDVLDIKDLTLSVPQLNVNQLLNYVAPSFTSVVQQVADGTDHIDPASLRGLGPDQVLVLINGKRRHSSSLVNVNSSVGRGSVGTDLNAIPAFAIDRIEVLRDGAAAQYGSDAIAGVINIILKDQTEGAEVAFNTGANFSNAGNNHTGGMDGEQLQLDINYGIPLSEKGGFLNFTGSVFNREPNFRAGLEGFSGSIYNGYNAIEWVANQSGADLANLSLGEIRNYGQQVSHFSSDLRTQIGSASTVDELRNLLNMDVSEQELAVRGLDRTDFSMRIGQTKLRSGKFMFNAQLPLSDRFGFYTFGGASYRNSQSAGFYRRPDQARANTAVYINGFLPEYHGDVKDQSVAIGIQGTTTSGWYVDFSNTWGRNSFDYTVVGSSNATLGRATPTSVYAGGFAFTQNTTNLDLTRYNPDVFSGLNIALGLEYRLENYEVFAGQEESWVAYDLNGDVVTGGTPDALRVVDFFGRQRPAGIQVFPGQRPENERNRFRNSYAAYVDFEADLSDRVVLGLAGRYENYSDFGDTFNWKLTSRFELSDQVSVRGGLSTGFRAPSLHQLHFSATSTNIINGVFSDVGTFSNDSRAARLLGIPALKQEKSFSGSIGLVAELPASNITITIDGFYTQIDDRVVLTGNFSRPDNPDNAAEAELQSLFDQADATQARFFTNAIDTETMGVDLVINHEMSNSWSDRIQNSLAISAYATEQVGDIQASDVLANAGLTETYFGTRDRLFLERALPRFKANLTHTLQTNGFILFLRNAWFGEVTNPNTITEGFHEVYSGRLITDVSITKTFFEGLQLTFGANNVFDVFPERVDPGLTSGNNFIYPRATSQFGINGRYLFLRLNFNIK